MFETKSCRAFIAGTFVAGAVLALSCQQKMVDEGAPVAPDVRKLPAPAAEAEPVPPPAPRVAEAPPPPPKPALTPFSEPREIVNRGRVPDADFEKIKEAAPDTARATPKKPRRILVFALCKGFKHGSIPFGSTAVEVMGMKTGAYETDVSKDVEVFRPANLAKYDAVCMNNTTGTLFKDEELRRSLLEFVRSGKSIIGIHAATDCFYDWPEYGEMMGGYFSGHPWHEDVGVKLDEPDHPLVHAFKGRNFVVKDEIYQFRDPYSRDALRVILSLDMSNTKDKGQRIDKDFAVSWVRPYGKGRVFYCSLGHRNEIFWNPLILGHYLDGMQFAFGDLPAPADPVPFSMAKAVDPLMGDYVGTYDDGRGRKRKAEAKVFPQGAGSYKAVLLPETDAGEMRIEIACGASAAVSAGEGTPLDVRLSNSPEAKKGVNYEYYEGDWDRLPDFDRLTPVKTGTASYFDIKPRNRDEQFGFRFKGFVKIAEDGNYTLFTKSDDGSALYIGDKEVVDDNDGLHGEDKKVGQINLEAGMHPITVTFFEKGGGEALSAGLDAKAPPKPESKEDDEEKSEGLELTGSADGVEWTGNLVVGKLTADAKAPGRGRFELKWIEKKSPTLGLEPPPGAAVVLPFEKGKKPSLDAWQNAGWKALADGSMQAAKGDNRTKQAFGHCRLHIEFMLPYEPQGRGQGRGNSGVYLQDRYEVQVLDSFGLVPRMGDCGAIYGVAIPRVNACLPPLTWQTYDIVFRSATDDAPTMFVSVKHNGVTIHEKQAVKGPTRASGARGLVGKGPLKLQDHGHPVRYRNIWFVELDEPPTGDEPPGGGKPPPAF